jgi:MoaA/NifB/PqqE/SkfB family radical SAM enzyme
MKSLWLKLEECSDMGLLYSKAKIFHFKDKLDSLEAIEDEVQSPLHVRLKPTNLCNHNCSYCAYSDKTLEAFGKSKIDRTFIPREKILEIVDDFIDMKVKAVTFSGGGEPFLYPYFIDLVKKLAASPIRFASLSNGSLLKGEAAELFAQHATWVRISMDGWDAKSYSKYRGVSEDAFKELISNLSKFKKMGDRCYLGVSYIIDQRNCSHVYDVLKLLREIGVNSVKLSACLVSDKAEDNNAYHADFFSRVSDQVERSFVDLRDSTFEISNAYQVMDEKFEKEYHWCPYQQILPVVGADLGVYSCPDKAYNQEEGLLGSLKDKSFKDFWFNGKDKFFKLNPSKHCRHHCETNHKNKLIFEYLDADKEHLFFV